jgi:hypothetical protein
MNSIEGGFGVFGEQYVMFFVTVNFVDAGVDVGLNE